MAWSDKARDAAAKARGARAPGSGSKPHWSKAATVDDIARSEGFRDHTHKLEMREWVKSHGGKNRYRPKSTGEW